MTVSTEEPTKEKSGTVVIECENCGNKETITKEEYNELKAGGIIEREERIYRKFDDNVYCNVCYSFCEICEDEYINDELTSVDDTIVCESCLDEHYRKCDGCGEYFKKRNTYTNNNTDGYYCESCYNEEFSWCAGCEEDYHNDQLIHCDNCDNDYCEGCFNHHQEEEAQDNLFFRKTEKKPRDIKRTSVKYFAVEIETSSKSPKYIGDKEIMKGCEGKEDSSISGGIGIEFTTPILRTNEGGFSRLRQICDTLRDNGYSVNKSCGLHLHLNIDETDKKDVSFLTALIFGFKSFERIIYRMLPESRKDNRYCKGIDKDFLSDLKRLGEYENDISFKKDFYSVSKGQIPDCEEDHYQSKRYYGLNLHSIFYRGSLELRYHSGTISPDKIINWVRINKKVVKYIKRNKNDIKRLELLGELWFLRDVLFIREKDLFSYMKERIEEFDGENQRQLEEMQEG